MEIQFLRQLKIAPGPSINTVGPIPNFSTMVHTVTFLNFYASRYMRIGRYCERHFCKRKIPNSRSRGGTGSPGHGSAGHRVSNLGPGRVTGQSPDPAF